eukprot:NODE_64_length_26047_cov_1.706837.p8 type:complete len:307 gc:universal NODE_64_length_26047_cov_1.706837:9965-9045(-)
MEIPGFYFDVESNRYYRETEEHKRKSITTHSTLVENTNIRLESLIFQFVKKREIFDRNLNLNCDIFCSNEEKELLSTKKISKYFVEQHFLVYAEREKLFFKFDNGKFYVKKFKSVITCVTQESENHYTISLLGSARTPGEILEIIVKECFVSTSLVCKLRKGSAFTFVKVDGFVYISSEKALLIYKNRKYIKKLRQTSDILHMINYKSGFVTSQRNGSLIYYDSLNLNSKNIYTLPATAKLISNQNDLIAVTHASYYSFREFRLKSQMSCALDYYDLVNNQLLERNSNSCIIRDPFSLRIESVIKF